MFCTFDICSLPPLPSPSLPLQPVCFPLTHLPNKGQLTHRTVTYAPQRKERGDIDRERERERRHSAASFAIKWCAVQLIGAGAGDWCTRKYVYDCDTSMHTHTHKHEGKKYCNKLRAGIEPIVVTAAAAAAAAVAMANHLKRRRKLNKHLHLYYTAN